MNEGKDMEYQSHTLANGIRLVHKKIASPVAHLGIFINAGSRDEETEEHGLAHFIEHAIFKGTKRRKAYHILSRMEDVGGEINAYTTKEETCIHTSFLKNDYERATELIWDIVFNSVFPGAELNREKIVILEEINSYKDDPAEQIFDDFEELVFKNQPLGKNILGSPHLLKKFGKKDIERFIQNNYFTDEMVICSVGNVEFNTLVKYIEKYFGQLPTKTRTKPRVAFAGYQPSIIYQDKHTHQAHCIIGNIAYKQDHPHKTAMILLDNLLGGPGLNSRLNLALRERKGFAYHIESSYTPYTDTGIFNVYFGSDKKNLEKGIQLILKEFQLLKNKPLGVLQLKKAKRQLYGQIAIQSENNANLLLAMGKSYLLFNRVDTLEDIHQKIEAVSADEIQKTANEVLDENNLSVLAYN